MIRPALALACLVFATVSVQATAAPSYTSLTVFGDSLVDAGNDLALGLGASPTQGYQNGRFTNGYDYTDLLSMQLFGAPTVASLKGGTNYAYGGARATPTSLVVDFAGQLASYRLDLGSGQADATGLVVLNFGANDVFAVQGDGLPPSFPGSTTYLQQAATDYAQGIQTLNDLGFKNFVVAGFPDLHFNAQGYAEDGESYLTTALAGLSLSEGTSLTRFSYLDLFNSIEADPTAYGLSANIILPPDGNCQDGNALPDCAGYFSIDGTHPTAAIQQLMYNQVASQLGLTDADTGAGNADVPEPASLALLALGLAAIGLTARRRSSRSVAA